VTRSLYIIGGAGTGKSTFMAEVLDRLGAELGPLENLHALQVHKNLVTLRGHRFQDGVYLGVMRDSFPGADGLDRVSGMTGEKWLADAPLPRRIVGEGLTLATRRFLSMLNTRTDLVVMHLVADPEVTASRCRERGSEQKETFVTGTATRMANLAAWCRETGITTCTFDSSAYDEWDICLDLAVAHVAL
jgi:hypothetical protein